jgi:hypothetical protein
MEYFGCEFLDLEDYHEPTTRSSWIWLPVVLIKKTLDPKYITEISLKDAEYIGSLAADIRQRGLRKPGKLVISKNKIKLQDGNHRFLAVENLGHMNFPVLLEFSEGAMSQGYLLQDLVKDILT